MDNLRAEMARYGISNGDIQKLLCCSGKTVKNKLCGKTEFTVSEALKIRNKYFKGYTLEYLFAPDMSLDELFSHDVAE